MTCVRTGTTISKEIDSYDSKDCSVAASALSRLEADVKSP